MGTCERPCRTDSDCPSEQYCEHHPQPDALSDVCVRGARADELVLLDVSMNGEARVEISLIKFHAARVLHDVIDRAVQVHGARGLTDETPLAAMLAMARGARIYDGPDEVHRMVVARRILASFEAGEPWRFS